MFPTALLVTLSTVAAAKGKAKRRVWSTIVAEDKNRKVTLDFLKLNGERTTLTRLAFAPLEAVRLELFPEATYHEEVKFLVGGTIKPAATTTFGELEHNEDQIYVLLMNLPEPTDEELALLRGAPDYFRKPGKSLVRLVLSRSGWDRRLRETFTIDPAYVWQEYVNFVVECPALREQTKEAEVARRHILATEPEVVEASAGKNDGMFETVLIDQKAYEAHGPLDLAGFYRLLELYPNKVNDYDFLRQYTHGVEN